jgi:hypothetical protein
MSKIIVERAKEKRKLVERIGGGLDWTGHCIKKGRMPGLVWMKPVVWCGGDYRYWAVAVHCILRVFVCTFSGEEGLIGIG